MKTHDQLNDLLMQISRPITVISRNGELIFPDPSDHFPSGASDRSPEKEIHAFVPAVSPDMLGDAGFKKRHGIRYPYIAGAMANGITSPAMVRTMAENGMIGFLGAGGLSLREIESHILTLKQDLPDLPFGFNLIHSLGDAAHEMATVHLYLKHGIRLVSAAAFLRMTPALVLYRVKGIHRDRNGRITVPNKIIAKVSRIEIARQFFAPPPENILARLVEEKLLTQEEADLASGIPMARDLTAEADSGGHTDNRPALALLPTMMALKDEMMETHGYDKDLCVGLGGGIATPDAAAAAFNMGAAYILTGSINQSCVEAGICDHVKTLLCQAEQADVAMAPAADMFEIGARVQVLKKGTMFPIRAEKLYRHYQSHNSFEEIPEKARKEIEEKFLLTSYEAAWESTKQFFQKTGNTRELEKAMENPRHKMALVFRSYLGQSSKWAIQGVPERRMDYQIWCGPAIGAFNQWVKGSFLEQPENRKTAEVALNLLFGACLSIRASLLKIQGITLAPGCGRSRPMKTEEIFKLL